MYMVTLFNKTEESTNSGSHIIHASSSGLTHSSIHITSSSLKIIGLLILVQQTTFVLILISSIHITLLHQLLSNFLMDPMFHTKKLEL